MGRMAFLKTHSHSTISTFRCYGPLLWTNFNLKQDNKWHMSLTPAINWSPMSATPAILFLPVRVADPYHLNADPDPPFHFNADPDPAPHIGDLWLLIYRPSRTPILSLQTTIVSVHGPPWLHFEPLKLLKFLFLYKYGLRSCIQLFTLMRVRIRIQIPAVSAANLDCSRVGRRPCPPPACVGCRAAPQWPRTPGGSRGTRPWSHPSRGRRGLARPGVKEYIIQK